MVSISRIKYFSYSISLILFALLIGGIIHKRNVRGTAFLMGVEFSGGIQVECEVDSLSSSPVSAEELKTSLESDGLHSISVRKLAGNIFIIRAPAHVHDNVAQFTDKVVASTNNNIGTCIVRDSSFVGPGVGKQLAMKAIVAVLLAFLLMFFYVWIRFRSWIFSVANGVSLFHDVLIIVLMILWFNYEVTLEIIGAILFIIGYSINDTIVIFSRIRENMELLKDEKGIDYIIGKSIVEMFRRTILTSFFTSLVVLPLWLFGGVNLEPLSAAVLLGIVFGTYSSIGIASPVLSDCYRLSSKKN